MNGLPKECRVNAALGTTHYTIEKAERPKKVLVLGGGPAGMEAARVSALRGHEVMLVEKTRKLGGSLPVAAFVKGTEIESLPALVAYLERQVTKRGVRVLTCRQFSSAIVDRFKPDVAIVATGGVQSAPAIPGIDGPNVVRSTDLHRSLKTLLRFVGPRAVGWLTKVWMPIGKRVVIIGGGIAACQLAEFLVKRGRRVTIVDAAENLGEGMVPERKNRLFSWFRKKGVAIFTGVTYGKVSVKEFTFTTKDGQGRTVVADTIIPAVPFSPDTELVGMLRQSVPEVFAVGDCAEPKLIPDAIAAAWGVARDL